MKYVGWIVALVLSAIVYGQHNVISQRDSWVNACDKALSKEWHKL